jgi:hypothetical protein
VLLFSAFVLWELVSGQVIKSAHDVIHRDDEPGLFVAHMVGRELLLVGGWYLALRTWRS